MHIVYVLPFLIGFGVFGVLGAAAEEMNVVFIDLEKKGESILVVTPSGGVMLIDGGLKGSNEQVKSVLRSYDVGTIDVMVSTHADQDHVAGLTPILQSAEFDVDEVLVSPLKGTTKTYQKFLDAIRQEGLAAKTVTVGQTIDLDDAVEITVLSPPVGGVPGADADDNNAHSVVIHMAYNDVSFLFTGDATAETEMFLRNNPLDVNIINGPHHGSKHSNTYGFIDEFDPELVVFSADADNQYGHPHGEVVTRYRTYDQSMELYQTGTSGDITIETNGAWCMIVFESGQEKPCYDGTDKNEYDGRSHGKKEDAIKEQYREDTKTDDGSRSHGEKEGVIKESYQEEAKVTQVPQWIKVHMGWWVEERVDDAAFTGAIWYLVSENIIHALCSTGQVSDTTIPEWVKQSVQWWIEGKTTEDEFLTGIQYLTSVGIIQVC